MCRLLEFRTYGHLSFGYVDQFLDFLSSLYAVIIVIVSTCRFGRRRPFIFFGSLAVAISVFLIGYAADLGHSLGDDLTKKN